MIQYKAGYKYQLVKGDECMTRIYPGESITTPFIELTVLGKLTVKPSYAWDGPSGPTFDTKNSMRASLFHDALYQLMRENHITRNGNRKLADQVLRDVAREDGMGKARSWAWYHAVQWGAKRSSKQGRPIQEAP